jgi:hypothetical protein
MASRYCSLATFCRIWGFIGFNSAVDEPIY